MVAGSTDRNDLKSLDPLGQEFSALNKYQCVASPLCNECGRDYSLAKRSCRSQHAVVVAFERPQRSCLWFTEISKKAYRQRLSKIAPVFGLDYDTVGAQEFYGLIETSARQRDMTRMKFGARDDFLGFPKVGNRIAWAR